MLNKKILSKLTTQKQLKELTLIIKAILKINQKITQFLIKFQYSNKPMNQASKIFMSKSFSLIKLPNQLIFMIRRQLQMPFIFKCNKQLRKTNH